MAATKRVSKAKPFKVELKFEPMEGFGGGFRQEWCSAEGKGFTAGIDSGSGLGNGYLTFWFKKKDGDTVYATASIRAIMNAGVSAHTKE